MITSNLFNNNSSRAGSGGVQNYAGNPQPITAVGQYCPIVAAFPYLITGVSYLVVAGAGVTAVTISLQLLEAFETSTAQAQTWVTATQSNSSTGAAFTVINGTAPGVYCGAFTVSNGLFVPVHGMRLAVTTLTGGTITYAELTGLVS